MTESLIGFAAVLFLVLLRMPIAFAMGLVGMVGFIIDLARVPGYLIGALASILRIGKF